jgi:AraC-like DNA-binding protein
MVAFFQFEYFVAFLSVIVAFVLYFAQREHALSPRILAVYFLCLGYVLFVQALVRYGHIRQYPHLWRTTVFAGTLNPVLAFIYFRSVLDQQYKLRFSDLVLLFLPVLMASTYLPFYFQSGASKQTIISEALANKSLYFQENEGLLPPGFALAFRTILALALAIAQYILLFKWYKEVKPRLPDNPQNQTIFKWLLFFTSVIAVTFSINAFQYLFQIFHQEDYYWVITSTAMVALFTALLYLLFKPNILYGVHGWVSEPQEKLEKIEKERLIVEKRGSISAELGLVYREKIEQYFSIHKPYLRKGYRVTNLAAETGIPLYQLSAFINQQYGQSFTELVNSHRIQYIKDVLANDSNFDTYTLEALGKKAGFNSRSTFINAVKKQTGQTPSLFFQDLGISVE